MMDGLFPSATELQYGCNCACHKQYEMLNESSAKKDREIKDLQSKVEHLESVNTMLQQRINLLSSRKTAKTPTAVQNNSVDVKLIKTVSGPLGSVSLYELSLNAEESGINEPQIVKVVTSYDLQKFTGLPNRLKHLRSAHKKRHARELHEGGHIVIHARTHPKRAKELFRIINGFGSCRAHTSKLSLLTVDALREIIPEIDPIHPEVASRLFELLDGSIDMSSPSPYQPLIVGNENDNIDGDDTDAESDDETARNKRVRVQPPAPVRESARKKAAEVKCEVPDVKHPIAPTFTYLLPPEANLSLNMPIIKPEHVLECSSSPLIKQEDVWASLSDSPRTTRNPYDLSSPCDDFVDTIYV